MDKQTTLDLFEPQEAKLKEFAKLEEEVDFELTQNLVQEALLEKEIPFDTAELWDLTKHLEEQNSEDDFDNLNIENFATLEDFSEVESDLTVSLDEIIQQETEITEDLVINNDNEEQIEIEINSVQTSNPIKGMTSAFENMIVLEDKQADEIRVIVEEEPKTTAKEDFGKVKIVVIGLGSCGCNAVNRMYIDKNDDIQLIAIDTSEQTLETISADRKILIGEKEFSGHGSGGNVELVERAFDDAKGKIQSILDNVDMLFLAGGLGRGTGSVGLSRIGQIARDMGILTIGFATLPSEMQGNAAICNEYYPKFLEAVDSSILVENDKIAEVARDLPIKKALEIADSMLVDGIRGIYEVITKPSKINLDFADIKTAFQNQGTAVMGMGTGHGENAVVKAITDAIHSEIIDIENVRQAQMIIYNVRCPLQFVTIADATRGTDLIYSLESDNKIQQLFFGYSYDPELVDEVKVTFIATGTRQETFDFNKRKTEQKFASFKASPSTPSAKFSFSPKNSISSNGRTNKSIDLTRDTEEISLFGNRNKTKEVKEEVLEKSDSTPNFFKR